MDELKNWMEKENTGSWTVLGPYITTPGGEKKYLCRCKCGTERYVLERSLIYGASTSCGCDRAAKAKRAVEHDLTGCTFGDLEVIHKAEKSKNYGGTWWLCRCSCGNETEFPGTLLVTGRRTHCGCKAVRDHRRQDITGRTFGRLTALYPLTERDRSGYVIWRCRCICGSEVDVSYNSLMYSGICSCGCQKREHEQSLGRFLTHVDGTSVDMLRSKKLPADNTTGVKGVYYAGGKWIAKIVFQKKQYYLGKYDTLEEAAKARRDAEKMLFDGTVAYYKQWESKAQGDPEWAENNPVQIFVSKKSTSELSVTFLPVIS